MLVYHKASVVPAIVSFHINELCCFPLTYLDCICTDTALAFLLLKARLQTRAIIVLEITDPFDACPRQMSQVTAYVAYS